MQEVKLSIAVKAPEAWTPEQAAQVVQHLIGLGLADAAGTLEDRHNADAAEVEHAQQAAILEIGAPVVAPKPRVLVSIKEGVADTIYDDGVVVEVFDWDNYEADPKGTGGVPSHFADLASPFDIPVEP